ncbi:MAG TPA: homocysteine S-methyltransferase [Caldilineaceae bacterium]|nr:homocysteine S-methyltransferase [Caldilineaceae bacterium]
MSMKLQRFTPFLERQGVVILDGALATALEARGADLIDPLWSAKLLLENPALIRQLHYDYLLAGADVIITASYQASFAGFLARGCSEEEAAALMQRSVTLADEARAQFLHDHHADRANQGRPAPLIAASIGPYGAYLHNGAEYTGEYGRSVAELVAWHRPRMAVLAHSGADLLACETIPSLAEAEALLQLLPEFPTMPAWLSFSCCDGEHLCHGEHIRAAMALANQSEQVIAVGVNCTAPRHVEALLRHARSATDKLLLAYPNRGERWDADAHCWVPGSGEEDFAQAAERWYQAGARLIGGCCRTGPAEIAQLRDRLRNTACL